MPEVFHDVMKFLSTPSARRATTGGIQRDADPRNFYPRPLRGGRQIQIGNYLLPVVFLSTPSARRATTVPPRMGHAPKISIHALCEEGDPPPPYGRLFSNDFYPRPLRGGRQSRPHRLRGLRTDFYPRPLRGGRPA